MVFCLIVITTSRRCIAKWSSLSFMIRKQWILKAGKINLWRISIDRPRSSVFQPRKLPACTCACKWVRTSYWTYILKSGREVWGKNCKYGKNRDLQTQAHGQTPRLGPLSLVPPGESNLWFVWHNVREESINIFLFSNSHVFIQKWHR